MIGTLLLVELTCCNCFTHFAMDNDLYRRRNEQGGTFYCPNGHGQHFTENQVEKLKKQNASLSKRVDWAEDSARRARDEAEQVKRERTAIKGHLTRTRKRIANGICPCCSRSFANVARHIENKHPAFKEVVG